MPTQFGCCSNAFRFHCPHHAARVTPCGNGSWCSALRQMRPAIEPGRSSSLWKKNVGSFLRCYPQKIHLGTFSKKAFNELRTLDYKYTTRRVLRTERKNHSNRSLRHRDIFHHFAHLFRDLPLRKLPHHFLHFRKLLNETVYLLDRST